MNKPHQTQLAPTQPNHRLVLLCMLSVLSAFQLSASTRCLAASGDRVILPYTMANKPGFSKDTGMQIQVDSTWSGERGYRPIRVMVTSTAPVTGDTQLTIRFTGGSWRTGARSMSVEHDFELAQGATTAQARFLVPQYSDWNTIKWEVWVDGVKDDALCQPLTGFSASGNGNASIGRLELGTTGGRWNGSSLIQTVTTNSIEEQVLDLTNLPETWLEYTTFDVVTTTPNALEFARVSAPDRLAHLLRWVRAGGNLWVLGVGTDFEQLAKLENVLSKAPQVDLEDESTNAPLDRWKFLDLEQKGRQRLLDLVRLTMTTADDGQQLTRAEIADSKFADTAVDSRQWFVARSYGLGTVVALQDDKETRKLQNAVVSTLQRSSVSDNINWPLRHGNDPGTGNPNFNHWLIADVGAAPVGAFQMLITLFAIAIGPVNYWFLKRRNQLPVMLLTVPLAALAATLLLFTYGFLADGVGSRVRARSLTVLDQVEGELAGWARLSYYAGIAPSEGLEIPKETAIYPILPSRSEYSSFGNQQANEQRVVQWEKQQQLTRGWLGSRTPTQYLTMTAKPSQSKLIFESADDGMKVRNQLGTDVVSLIVQDHEGNLFVGDKLNANDTANLTPSNFVDASSQLRQFFSKNLLQLPPGYIDGNRSRRRDYGNSMTEGLMELNFEAMTSPQANGWGNGSYIAITDQAVELSLGLPEIEETESFHVVRGSW